MTRVSAAGQQPGVSTDVCVWSTFVIDTDAGVEVEQVMARWRRTPRSERGKTGGDRATSPVVRTR